MKLVIHDVHKVHYQNCVQDPDPFRGGSRAGANRSQEVPSFKNLLRQKRLLDLKTKCIKAIYKDGLLKIVFGMKIRVIKIDAFLTSFLTLSNPCKIAYSFIIFSSY